MVLPLRSFARLALTGLASVSLHRDGVLREMPGYDDGFVAMIATGAGIEAELPEPGTLIKYSVALAPIRPCLTTRPSIRKVSCRPVSSSTV